MGFRQVAYDDPSEKGSNQATKLSPFRARCLGARVEKGLGAGVYSVASWNPVDLTKQCRVPQVAWWDPLGWKNSV